ncbi:MAG TPA: AAA family ATPase [Aquella sp.]|nr:AAA family ATPase [Aquella sp.]
MKKHFLTRINCINYKLFKDFEVGNLKRVNLIGGKNNIGKTALMEACFINSVGKDISLLTTALVSVKYSRENLNILMSPANYKPLEFIENANGLRIESNINNVSFEVETSPGQITYVFNAGQQKQSVNRNLFAAPVIGANMPNIPLININMQLMSMLNIPNAQFIDSYGMSHAEIKRNFNIVQKLNKESSLDAILKRFDDSIDGFKIIDDKPKCYVKNEWLDITEMGDGTRHLISIVISLFYSKDGYLYIDEIDNGVHHEYLPEMWKIIFELSNELDCQVFATTHSRECIEAFNKSNKDNEGLYIELYRNQKNESIMAKYRDYEQLQYSLTNEDSFRGE